MRIKILKIKRINVKTIKQFSVLSFFLLFLLLFFLVGCGGTSGVSYRDNYKQGLAEVNLRLLENAPPEKIYPASNFKVILELDNQAAYDITGGRISIVGLDSNYFRMDYAQQNFERLEARSPINPAGDEKYLEFDGIAGQLFQNAESYSGNYFIKMNYHSNMDFGTTLCINSRLYEVYDSGCQAQGAMSFSGQGAPLAVASLEPLMYPSGAGAQGEFRMTLKNMGRGKVTQVTFNTAQLGGETLECEFKGNRVSPNIIIFDDKTQEATLICKAFFRNPPSYTTTLSASFSYDYYLEERHTLNLVK